MDDLNQYRHELAFIAGYVMDSDPAAIEAIAS